MKQSLFGVFFALLLSLFSAHASEDYWRDTLWIRKIPLGGNTYAKIMFHPDGKSVFAASDHYLFRYDVLSGEILETRQTQSGLSIADYELTSDNKQLIIGTNASGTTGKSVMEIWDMEKGFIRKIPLEYQCASIELSKDNQYVYVGYRETFIHKIDIKTGQVSTTTNKANGGVLLSPDANEILSYGGSMTNRAFLLNAETLEMIKEITPLYAASYDKTGRYICGAGANNIVYLYDRQENKSYPLENHKGQLSDVCFTSDGKYVLSCSRNEENGGYRAWGVTSKKLEYTAPFPFNGGGIAVSPDNNFITFGGGGSPGIFTIRMPNLLVNVNDPIESSKCIDIFPNPSTEFLSIKLNTFFSDEKKVLQVIDMKGNILFNDEAINYSQMYPLYTKDLATGKYFIQILQNSVIICSTSFIINR